MSAQQPTSATATMDLPEETLVAAGLTWCPEDPSRSADAGCELADVQTMFLTLA